MTISQRLRTCAKHTGLDAVIELLQEAADEIDALQARAQVQGEPVMDVRCEGCGYMTHHREHMGCVRAAKQHTHPAPSVPADVVRVPVQVLKDASEALGNFVSDHGWGDADMQAMDNLDAYIARHEANRAAMLAAK
jgi:hypothetical protein